MYGLNVNLRVRLAKHFIIMQKMEKRTRINIFMFDLFCRRSHNLLHLLHLPLKIIRVLAICIDYEYNM